MKCKFFFQVEDEIVEGTLLSPLFIPVISFHAYILKSNQQNLHTVFQFSKFSSFDKKNL